MGDEDNSGGGDFVGLRTRTSSSAGSRVRKRHGSTTVAEEVVTEELKQRRAQPDRPYANKHIVLLVIHFIQDFIGLGLDTRLVL